MYFYRARRDLVATLGTDIPTYVTRLRFSPDGRYLAVLRRPVEPAGAKRTSE
jgi:hypothetical protein